MDLQPPKNRQETAEPKEKQCKNLWPHVQCQIKTSNYNCLRALVFCGIFLFGTSSAKTVREHDQWSQTQETTPTQETQRKKKRKTESQEKRPSATDWH